MRAGDAFGKMRKELRAPSRSEVRRGQMSKGILVKVAVVPPADVLNDGNLGLGAPAPEAVGDQLAFFRDGLALACSRRPTDDQSFR